MKSLSRTQDLVAELMNIGEVLKRLCLVSADDVKTAVERQRESKRRLGEELVAMGRLTPAELSDALDLQLRLKERSSSVLAMAELMESAMERSRGRKQGTT